MAAKPVADAADSVHVRSVGPGQGDGRSRTVYAACCRLRRRGAADVAAAAGTAQGPAPVCRESRVTVLAARPERPVGLTPRRDSGLSAYERVLARAGFGPVAGVDEAGRGACAGPLVVAAVMLRPARIGRLTELADSKALTAAARNVAYRQVMDAALDWHVVVIPAADIDRIGLHVCNVAGMRRSLAGLRHQPGYVLTDGFPVRGLSAPAHMRALAAHGPCPEHRKSFVNVRGCRPADVEQALESEEILVPAVTEVTDVAGTVRDNEGCQVSCYGPGSGQNGPIVDIVDEPGWPTAGFAVMARGA